MIFYSKEHPMEYKIHDFAFMIALHFNEWQVECTTPVRIQNTDRIVSFSSLHPLTL